MTDRRQILFKHTGSCLGDQLFDYEINVDKKTVEVRLKALDTALFEGFVRHLEQDHGVRVFADDNEGWAPTVPAWSQSVWIGDQRFAVTAAKLMDIGQKDRIAIVLRPMSQRETT